MHFSYTFYQVIFFPKGSEWKWTESCQFPKNYIYQKWGEKNINMQTDKCIFIVHYYKTELAVF